MREGARESERKKERARESEKKREQERARARARARTPRLHMFVVGRVKNDDACLHVLRFARKETKKETRKRRK